jgi:Flp pilus assembly pilin Flp
MKPKKYNRLLRRCGESNFDLMERIAVYGVIVVLVAIGLVALLVLVQSGNQNAQFTTSTAPQGGNTTPQSVNAGAV